MATKGKRCMDDMEDRQELSKKLCKNLINEDVFSLETSYFDYFVDLQS